MPLNKKGKKILAAMEKEYVLIISILQDLQEPTLFNINFFLAIRYS